MLEQEAEAYAYMPAGDNSYQTSYANNMSNYNPNHNSNSYHPQNQTDYQAWSSNPDDLVYEEEYGNYSA